MLNGPPALYGSRASGLWLYRFVSGGLKLEPEDHVSTCLSSRRWHGQSFAVAQHPHTDLSVKR